MMTFAIEWLGRLTWHALAHNIVTMGGVVGMVGGLVAICAGLTYYQKWTWLWREWVTTTDHKRIGIMYITVSSVMLVRGVADALLLRAQQATSAGNAHGVVSSDQFQQIFSAHGSIMIFFVAMGFMFGLINLILPLQLGARDVAFPWLNNFSFWLFAAGAILINASLVIGEFSAAGWLAYPPLSELKYSPGVGVDYWNWSLQISGIGSLLSGVNFLTTILTMRAPGMTPMKMPMFAWSVLGSMILVVFAFPILAVTLALLELDRTLGMHFFTADMGGNPMMYVNLIWAWGHPEVYILILPAFGVFSEVVATFSRKRLFGYTSMVWAIGAIVFLSFTVWLHHFFTMGAGADVNAFFGIMTMVIAVPTGVKLFNWLFTMYRGRIHFATPLLWFFGFVVTFTIGGVAGVLMSVPPADFQLHNSLFLVAHFHTMIIGGVLFGYFAGLDYWFPKIFGYRLSERLGRYAIASWVTGFVLAFTPLYVLGLMGATRRMDHYDASLGWQGLFIVAGVGVLFVFLGIGIQILRLGIGIFQRKWNRDPSGDPWVYNGEPLGRTLEWSTPSPAPAYNFATIPVVHDRDAWWLEKQTRQASMAHSPQPTYHSIQLPKNSGLGFAAALAIGLFGFAAIWHIWWLAGLSLVGMLCAILLRASQDKTEYTLSAKAVARMEHEARV